MKYEDIQKCISIAENTCSLSGMRIADADVSVISFQEGANGGIKQKVRFLFEFKDANVAIEIEPKEAK